MKTIIGILFCLTLFPKVVFAQDALCFMEWHGNIIDLTISVCKTKINNISAAKPNSLSASDIRLSNVEIEQAINGTSLEIKGTITNESEQVSSLSVVKFNVINHQNGRVLTTDTIILEAGAGLEPGEQIAFSKLISKNIVGGNVKISDLNVEITSSL
jgi:hypothetical protein